VGCRACPHSKPTAKSATPPPRSQGNPCVDCRDHPRRSPRTLALIAAASGLATRVRPFPWVNTVGSEAFGAARLPTAQSKLGKGAKLELPPGFVRFYQQSHNVYAINRGQVVIKITRQSNFDAAGAGFWADQVRDRLTQDLGVPVEEPTKITIRDNEVGYAMTGNRPAGKDPLGYFVGLAANKKHVFLIEAWGPADQLIDQHEALTASLKTLRVNRGWW